MAIFLIRQICLQRTILFGKTCNAAAATFENRPGQTPGFQKLAANLQLFGAQWLRNYECNI
jgi:hypothetical protein